MSVTLIASTPRGSMHPLAFQGIPVAECHTQIVDLIRARLGDSHVLLFAEPVFDVDREIVDWYSPVRGTPQRLTDLPEEQRTALLAILGKMGEELRIIANTLIDSGEQRRIMSGNILKLALNYPGEECLFVVGDQPVITCWGFGPATVGAQPQDISRLSASVPPSPPPNVESPTPTPPQPEKKPSGFSVLWLLPLLLLLVLAALSLVSFGGHPPLLPLLPDLHIEAPALFPSSPGDPAPSEESLMAELAALRAKLDERAALCPKKEQTQKQPKEEPNELLVPPTPDLGFMRGVWKGDTGLRNAKSGTPVSVEYTFDGSGGGQISISGDKGICTAPLKTTLDDTGTLTIETDAEIPCPNGTPYSGQRIECYRQGNGTQCHGRNLSPGAQTWKANFHRKK